MLSSLEGMSRQLFMGESIPPTRLIECKIAEWFLRSSNMLSGQDRVRQAIWWELWHTMMRRMT